MTIVLDVGAAQPFATIGDAVAVMTSLADDYEVILHDAIVADSGVLIDGGRQVTIRSSVPAQAVVWLIHEVAGLNDPLEYGARVEGSSPAGVQTTVLIEDVFFVVGLVSMTPSYLDQVGAPLYALYDAVAPGPNLSPVFADLTSLPPAYGSPPANLRPQSTSKAVDGSVTISVLTPSPVTVVPPSKDLFRAPRAPIADVGALETR